MKYQKLEGAVVTGNVEIGEDSGVWYNAVIRGDSEPIKIGKCTNIQDCAVLHVDAGSPLTIGDFVTVGHGAILHGCTVEDNVLIGMGAIIMNHAIIGEGSLVAAGALVTGGTVIPPRSLVIGSPAKVKRELTEEELKMNRENAVHYAEELKALSRK